MMEFTSRSLSTAATMYFGGTLLKMPLCIKVNTEFPGLIEPYLNIIERKR